MGFKKSKTIILLFFIFTSKLFAYDYPWEVEYKFTESSIKKINLIVKQYICNTPEIQVYRLDSDAQNEKKLNLLGFKIDDDFYKLSIGKSEHIPFGQVLGGKIYLKDVNTIVGFYIPHIQGTGKNCIRLVSYSPSCKMIEEKVVATDSKYFLFNDVEPTKKEIPIKESFERNFLSKLPLEFEYQKPAALDRFLSKLLTTLYRPRKNFVDN